MKAELLMRERLILSSRAFVEIVIWKLPQPLADSQHTFKYRLAYIANQRCVVRFDNEAGAKAITSIWMRSRRPTPSVTSTLCNRIFGLMYTNAGNENEHSDDRCSFSW
jgi:Family of unknown function (DUF6516)